MAVPLDFSALSACADMLYGSPLVTASVDFVGTMALVLAVSVLALT